MINKEIQKSDSEEEKIENRLQKLSQRVDDVSYKTSGMLRRSYQLKNSSEFLKDQVDRMAINY